MEVNALNFDLLPAVSLFLHTSNLCYEHTASINVSGNEYFKLLRHTSD